MAGIGPSRSTRLQRTIVLLVSIGFAVCYAYIAISRVVYPYDLEFIEDAILMQAMRIANNQAVFVPPNADFVPQPYMPLYSWLGGLLFKLTGPAFAPLRLLSLGATLVTAILIYWIVRREAGGLMLAVTCSSLFLSGYRIAGGWYELARVDALFLALTLGGVATAVYSKESALGLMGSALLLALAFMTKQNALFFAIVVGFYLILSIRQRAAIYIATFVALVVLPTSLLHMATDGWFSTYVFGIAFANPMTWIRALFSVVFELFGDMALLTFMFIAVLVTSFGDRKLQVVIERPWLLFISAAMLTSVFGRASVGGSTNHLMQAYAFLCLSVPLFVREMRKEVAPWRTKALKLVWLALLLQFGLTAVNPVRMALGFDRPTRFLPTEAMQASGERLISRLAGIEGNVLVMMHPFYAVQAAKRPSVHIQSLWHARWRGQEPLPADLVSRIEDHYYSAIVSDESSYFETEPALVELIEAHYVPGEILSRADAPPTLNGMVVRPKVIYVPR